METYQIRLNYNFFIRIFFFLYILLSSFFAYAFNLNEVKNGLFVHYGKHEDSDSSNKGDISNIGFIIGEKSVLVIDAGGTPRIADKLIEKIKSLTDLPISHVIITHGHPDHFLGMSSFSKFKPIFIGHQNLKRSLLTNFDFYKKREIERTKDLSLTKSKIVIPNVEVKKNSSIDIDIGNRKITLKAWRSGHTDNDLSVYDHKTKTLWTENIFVRRVPTFRASILGWKKNLEETLKLDIDNIIPGHGKITSKEKAIKPMLYYLNRIINEVRILHLDGGSIEKAQNEVAKENIENWVLYNNYNISNVSKAYSELEWE